MRKMYHHPVLLNESIMGLAIKPNGTYVDATYGGGGHSREILKRLDNGKLIAFDQDEDAMNERIDDERLLLLNHNFRFLKNFLKYYHLSPVDGIIADLGVSSHQIDTKARGFSSRLEGPLDLRMDQKLEITASDIVNNYPEKQLIYIFKTWGEIKEAVALTREILNARTKRPINTIEQLKEIARSLVPRQKENKFYAKLLQALRIVVNDEIEALKDLLNQSYESLKPGGRLVILTYQSIEDKLVKNYFRTGNFEGQLEKDFYGKSMKPLMLINKKPIVPDALEITENSRARSAKLRIAKKTRKNGREHQERKEGQRLQV